MIIDKIDNYLTEASRKNPYNLYVDDDIDPSIVVAATAALADYEADFKDFVNKFKKDLKELEKKSWSISKKFGDAGVDDTDAGFDLINSKYGFDPSLF